MINNKSNNCQNSNPIPKLNPQTKIIIDKEKETVYDSEGNSTTTEKEKTRKVTRLAEPDYIKIYTLMWCEFNAIPEINRPLFLELAVRMSYCNTTDLGHSQIVYTGEPIASEICKRLGWNQKDSLMKGLKALVKCNAIKKVNRAVYQINPSYAGRGEWKYNPQTARGGIEDLITTFRFKDKQVDTEIIWADDGKDNDFNEMYREGLHVNKDDNTVLKHTEIKASNQ